MKKYYLIPLAIIALLGGFFGAEKISHSLAKKSTPSVENHVENSPSAPKTTSESTSKATDSQPTSTSSNTVSENPDGKTPEQYSGENPNSNRELTGVFTVARYSAETEQLTVRVLLDQYLASGECTLYVQNDDGATVVEKSVEITPSASSSTCAGFDLSVSNSFSRPLTLNLAFSSGDKSGFITTTVE